MGTRKENDCENRGVELLRPPPDMRNGLFVTFFQITTASKSFGSCGLITVDSDSVCSTTGTDHTY